MKKNLFIAIALIGGSLMFTSCGSLPETEIAAATTAVQEVKDLGADVYVPEAYQAIVDSMASADKQLTVAKSKWFKTYKKEKAAFVYITTMSADVKTKTEARKAELKAETENLLTEVKTLSETNKSLMAKAPKGKEGRIVLIAIAQDVATIDAEVITVDSLLTNGNLLESNEKIKTVKDLATKINVELNEVISKVKK